MRRRFPVAILGAVGFFVLAVALGVWVAASRQQETAATGIIVEIPDNPAALAATKVQEADVVAALPDAIEEEVVEDDLPPEAPPPQELHIADAIRAGLNNPTLRADAYAEDLAAVEAFYARYSGPALWVTSAGLSPQAQSIIGEIAKAGDWGLDPGAFVVPPADYQPAAAEDQAATEIAIDLGILKYARYARGGRADPSALSKLIDQTPPLRDPKTVLTEIAASETPDTYLRDLHPKHEQFERLRQALLKARADASAKPEEVKRLLINMERWRWMPENLGALYVQLNTPEFMVYVVKDGKTIHSEKIVVGKLRYATPVFSADLKTIVFNPEWTVPPTIVREDLLPKLRGGGGWFSSNTKVLKTHRLKTYYKGREVDPDNIDWNKVNMSAVSFRQAPGPHNVLGKVKFLYPNKHVVYMHDTIKRELLNKAVRAEGHNCPRVANPGKMAAVLLAEDKGWDTSKIQQLLDKGYNSSIALDHPIPVHTTYFTAVVDEDGKVKTFADVYKLDGVVAKAIIGNGSVKDAMVAETAPLPPRKPESGSLAASTP
jgi:murein L,D-transpeptidase YcbB/YkuD